MNVGEFFMDTLEPLWRMSGAGVGLNPGPDARPLLLDRRARLAPVTDAFRLPDFYHWLLAPLSERPVRNQLSATLGMHGVVTTWVRAEKSHLPVGWTDPSAKCWQWPEWYLPDADRRRFLCSSRQCVLTLVGRNCCELQEPLMGWACTHRHRHNIEPPSSDTTAPIFQA